MVCADSLYAAAILAASLASFAMFTMMGISAGCTPQSSLHPKLHGADDECW